MKYLGACWAPSLDDLGAQLGPRGHGPLVMFTPVNYIVSFVTAPALALENVWPSLGEKLFNKS